MLAVGHLNGSIIYWIAFNILRPPSPNWERGTTTHLLDIEPGSLSLLLGNLFALNCSHEVTAKSQMSDGDIIEIDSKGFSPSC